ncbi:VWA domain-containing protein [Bengtsoniella intestinalis]|uniref:vWA domain-containing protein n=1 Tax=Bengtsoniella intestinalis TaxID=3073143 RepID=UPI00391EF4F0
MKKFTSLAQVLASPWGQLQQTKPQTTDRIYKSSRLEDSIYADLRQEDATLDELEMEATQKLASFPSLSRDVYQSFYSLSPKKNDEGTLSAPARKFNGKIIDHVVGDEDYPTLKSICEGRELPAFEAATEFVGRVSENLDGLLEDIGGKKGALNTLEKLEDAKLDAERALNEALTRLESSKHPTEQHHKDVVDAANKAASKSQQVAAVTQMIDSNLARNKAPISDSVSSAVSAALARGEEVQDIIEAWSDEPSNMERSPANLELIRQVRQSKSLLNISKYLGRFREMFAQGKKNGFAYGRGETYSITLGRDISKALTSELAMTATPNTLPLFLRKYQQGQVKQYQRREPIKKGMGDIICCLDESGSTRGDAEAWGKAVAMTLLEIAAEGNRKFALVHFSSHGDFVTDLFIPEQYDTAKKLKAAETFLDGGTDYETPLNQAMDLITRGSFENADIVFITDGVCSISEGFKEQLHTTKQAHNFSITGILLDNQGGYFPFTLAEFADHVYRTSELQGEEIVEKLVVGA